VSNWLAVATVTAAVRELIEAAIAEKVPGARVTTRLPEDVDTSLAAVNVFLYSVSREASFANNDLPTRTSNSVLMRRPETALTLHYLFTFVGDKDTFEPQRLLGATVARLHAQPELLRGDITRAIQQNPVLFGSDLASQHDLVRFVSVDPDTDDFVKLWSMMLKTKYALSRAYDATVVMLTEPGITNAPLPAVGTGGTVTPGAVPVIYSVKSDGPFGRIIDGSTLTITGKGFGSDATRLKIGDAILDVLAGSDTEIVVTLDSATTPDLRAGVSPVTVMRGAFSGEPPLWSATAISRPFQIVVVPTVVAASFTGLTLAVTIAPAVGVYQLAEVLLNPRLSERRDGWGFAARPRELPATVLEFEVLGVPSGEALLRVAVDGIQSTLERGPDDFFDRPSVVVP
jgi:hypothetical protein